MLEVRDLWVGVSGKEILKGIDLIIREKEKHVLFGPNGRGEELPCHDHYGYPYLQGDKKENSI